jgi:hypothetical protein
MLMASSSARRTYRAEREFGLVVGGVFLILGGWWTYRDKLEWLTPALLGVGAALVLIGSAYPRALGFPFRAWMKLAEALAFVMTRVILGLVFFLVVTPIGIVKRLTGWDPLRRRAPVAESYWKPYAERQRDKRHYEKMF